MHVRAEMGAGTLIIFVALLLVTAVAASVLLQTTSAAQQHALKTGKQARDTSSSIMVREISATSGTGVLQNVSVWVTLVPGSDTIALDDIMMLLTTQNTTTHYLFSVNATVDASTANGTFSAQYVQRGSAYTQGMLSRGDIIECTVLAPRALASGEEFRLLINPQTGFPVRIHTWVPYGLVTERVHLYP